jgi:hypothetical protein
MIFIKNIQQKQQQRHENVKDWDCSKAFYNSFEVGNDRIITSSILIKEMKKFLGRLRRSLVHEGCC